MIQNLIFRLFAVLSWLAVLLLPVGSALALSQQKAPTFNARVDLVSLDTEVLDSQGNPVFGLAKEEFQVKENGRLVEITHFVELHDRPVSLALVLDASAIPRKEFSTAKEFIFRLIHILDRQDEICLFTFDDKDAYLEQDFTRDRVPLLESLRNLAVVNSRTRAVFRDLLGASPRTALGIDKALAQLQHGSNEKRAVLVISNRFKGLGPATVEHVQKSGYVLLTLSFKNKINWLVTLGGDQISKNALMDQTGGRRFSANQADLTASCRAITSALKNHYNLAYQTVVGEGQPKKRIVEVFIPNQKYTIYARRSYIPKP